MIRTKTARLILELNDLKYAIPNDTEISVSPAVEAVFNTKVLQFF